MNRPPCRAASVALAFGCFAAAIASSALGCKSSGSGDDGDTDTDASVASDASYAVRSCGRSGTTAATTTVSVVVPTFTRVALGQGVDANGNLLGATYATGTTEQPSGADSNDFSVATSDGVEVNEAIKPVGDHSLVEVKDGGTSPFDDLHAAYSVGALRLVLASSGIQAAGDFELANASLASTAPANASYVFTLSPTTFSVFALKLEFPDACALGAIGDVLGRTTDDPPALQDILLAAETPTTAQALSNVLVREGVTASIELMTNVPRPTLQALVPNDTTTCGVANLPACATLNTAVQAAIHASGSSQGLPSSFAAIQAGTDPTWSFTGYITAP